MARDDNVQHPGRPDLLLLSPPVPPPISNIPSRAPLPAAQSDSVKLSKRATQDHINKEVEKWYQHTKTLAASLGERVGRPAAHFEAIFFNYADTKERTREPSAWNAWLSRKCEDENTESDTPQSLLRIQEDFSEAYSKLTADEKSDLIADLKLKKTDKVVNARLDQRSVSATLRHGEEKLQATLRWINQRTGCQGVYFLTRGTGEVSFNPSWYFTHDSVEQFLRVTVRRGFDTHEIATKAEAFYTAGGDTASLITDARKKSRFLKNCIEGKVHHGLVTITGDPEAEMEYVNYWDKIVLRYGVGIVGWTHREWSCPSKMSSAVAPLQQLNNALIDGSCKWVTLTGEAVQKHRASFERRFGPIETHKRKQRSDAGVSKGPRPHAATSDSDDESHAEDDDDDVVDNADDDEECARAGRKRPKTTAHAAKKPAAKKPAPKKPAPKRVVTVRTSESTATPTSLNDRSASTPPSMSPIMDNWVYSPYMAPAQPVTSPARMSPSPLQDAVAPSRHSIVLPSFTHPSAAPPLPWAGARSVSPLSPSPSVVSLGSDSSIGNTWHGSPSPPGSPWQPPTFLNPLQLSGQQLWPSHATLTEYGMQFNDQFPPFTHGGGLSPWPVAHAHGSGSSPNGPVLPSLSCVTDFRS